ncbi:uncharacterized protein N7498_007787 [Penicillium cinerascens]|uniref:Putative transcription factor kapC n=1 Tax=Penicillium cinerascens TaxID=70096 RepID=A0A9W9MDP4_9EURO|nr:uncharacterized protein N7498_007787 [Penicillium cinerascens]KAJ5198670.1 hypothetical protein N7498_007787 [Penicillium cinerascens]
MQPALAPAPHPSMQSSAQDHADQVLHDRLLAAQHQLQQGRPQGGPQQQHLQPNTASTRDQANIDPAISGAAMLSAAPQTPTQPHQGSPDDGTPKSYGKRELSTSKRAAQNRAAQRAFRQRKETYIRKLEEENKQTENIREQLKHLISENYSLREYVINLQSRLMDLQAEVPEIPGNIDLSQPPRHELALAAGLGGGASAASAGQQPQHPGPANDDMNSLNRIAVAGLGMRKHPDDGNFMGNNFQPNKRVRGDEGQDDGSDVVAKQEGHGLPMA